MSTVIYRISRLRRRYKPGRIKVLFVAESLPESSDAEVRFFYNPEQERGDHLYRAVMKVVFPEEFKYRRGEKDKWLRKFKGHCYYLIDATDRPVNRLSSAERRRALDAALEPKLSEINLLVSPSTPIVLVKKNVFEAFYWRLRNAGYYVVNEAFLPFPSHGHQNEFVRECRDCLCKAKQ